MVPGAPHVRRRGPVVSAALLAALILGDAWPACAQSPPAAESLASYLQLVARYRSGQTAVAADTLGTWLRAEVSSAIRLLSARFGRAAPAGPDAVDLVTLEAAVLMHTDAAISAYSFADRAGGEFHLSNAQSLVDLMDDTSARRATVKPTHRRVPTKEWLLIAGSIALQALALDEAEAFYRRALAAASDDPQVLLALGGYCEVRHWQQASSFGLRGRPSRGVANDRTARMLDQMRVATNLNEGAKHLARALAIDDGLDEARLRLARIEMLRGKHREADRLLAQVTAESEDPAVRYLAALFSARLRDAEGDDHAALDFYRRAAALLPWAQAARVGLAQALERNGAVEDARAALGSLPPRPNETDAPPDPWWTYRLAYAPRAYVLLERLRGAVCTP